MQESDRLRDSRTALQLANENVEILARMGSQRTVGLTAEEREWVDGLQLDSENRRNLEAGLATTYRPLTGDELRSWGRPNPGTTLTVEEWGAVACKHCDPTADEHRLLANLFAMELRSNPLSYTKSGRRWEAKADGLSGRMVRGYRHWRNKR
jgi:hypothetical protein